MQQATQSLIVTSGKFGAFDLLMATQYIQHCIAFKGDITSPLGSCLATATNYSGGHIISHEKKFIRRKKRE